MLKDEIEKSYNNTFIPETEIELIGRDITVNWACSEITNRNSALVEFLENRITWYESRIKTREEGSNLLSYERGIVADAKIILAMVKGGT